MKKRSVREGGSGASPLPLFCAPTRKWVFLFKKGEQSAHVFVITLSLALKQPTFHIQLF